MCSVYQLGLGSPSERAMSWTPLTYTVRILPAGKKESVAKTAASLTDGELIEVLFSKYGK